MDEEESSEEEDDLEFDFERAKQKERRAKLEAPSLLSSQKKPTHHAKSNISPSSHQKENPKLMFNFKPATPTTPTVHATNNNNSTPTYSSRARASLLNPNEDYDPGYAPTHVPPSVGVPINHHALNGSVVGDSERTTKKRRGGEKTDARASQSEPKTPKRKLSGESLTTVHVPQEGERDTKRMKSESSAMKVEEQATPSVVRKLTVTLGGRKVGSVTPNATNANTNVNTNTNANANAGPSSSQGTTTTAMATNAASDTNGANVNVFANGVSAIPVAASGNSKLTIKLPPRKKQEPSPVTGGSG
jgi:hypothetical protein